MQPLLTNQNQPPFVPQIDQKYSAANAINSIVADFNEFEAKEFKVNTKQMDDEPPLIFLDD